MKNKKNKDINYEKQKKQKNYITIALLLLTAFSGCTEDTPDSEETSNFSETESDTVAEETSPLDLSDVLELPEMNWEGRDFHVLGQLHPTYSQFSNMEIDAEDITGDALNDAVYNRNLTVEDKYKVNIMQTLAEGGSGVSFDTLNTSVLAQEDLYDVAFIVNGCVGNLAQQQMLYDLNTVGYIDFSKNWWNQSANESLSIDNKLYFSSSDFSLTDKHRTYIMFYNKDLVTNYNLDNPTELVRSGKWTLDVLHDMVELIGSDLDGNGEIDVTDQFGFVGDSANSILPFVVGCGETLIKKNEEDSLVVTTPAEIVDSLDKIMTFWTNERAVTVCENWVGKVSYDTWEVSSKLFNQGKALFNAGFVHSLETMSANCEYNYGVIPFPKYDETQSRYYAVSDANAMQFCIPITSSEPDFSGFMLEALSEASTDTTLKTYIDIMAKSRYVYDPDSADMLDLIFDSIIYDHASIFGINGASGLLYNYGLARTVNYASDYAGMIEMANDSIDKLIEDIRS